MRLSLDLGVSLRIDMNVPFARSPNATRDALYRVHRQLGLVVTFSFLPKRQCNGRDLPRDRQKNQLGFVSAGHFAFKVRSPRSVGRCAGGTLEHVLQDAVAVGIQPAQSRPLFGPTYSSLNQLVLCGYPRHDGQSRVAPELPFAAKPVRRQSKGKNQCGSHGSYAGDSLQDPGRWVLPCLDHHVLLGFCTQHIESIELPPQPRNSQPHCPGFELARPALTLFGRVDATPGIVDPPRSEHGFESVLDSRTVPYDGAVASCQLLQSPRAPLPVVDGRQGIRAQQLRQPLRIRPIRLVTLGRDLPRITHHNLGDVRLDQIVKPGRLGSLFKRHPQRAALALNEVQDHRPLRFDDGLSHDLSRRTQHRADSHCLVHVHTDILGYVHWALPPWFGFCYQLNPTTGGALFCIACYTHRCLVKRSQALRGRNLTRDNQADGAPMVHQASGDNKLPEAFLMESSDTGAMPQKIPGSGAEPQANRKLLGPGRTPSHAALRGRPFIMREDAKSPQQQSVELASLAFVGSGNEGHSDPLAGRSGEYLAPKIFGRLIWICHRECISS